MSWSKAVIAGVVGGIVVTIANFVIHGFIMAATYAKYPIFQVEEPASEVYFPVVAIFIAVPAAILFALTRESWAAGIKGGVTFGFFVGMISFFSQFYNPLVLEGFPYYLSWCWGGINLIGFLILGAVLGMMIKKK
jgi:hypothetical protein